MTLSTPLDLPGLRSCVEFPSKNNIQKKVTESLGIIRDRKRMEKLRNWLSPIIEAYQDKPARYLTKKQSERWNIITVAYLMTLSMLERTESRGAHYRVDYQYEDLNWQQKRILRERVNGEPIQTS